MINANKHLPAYLLAFYLVLALWGCRDDAQKTVRAAGEDDRTLLERLTSISDTERFAVLDAAKARIGHIPVEDIETTLTSLHPKNVSTLIYVCMKTGDPVLYRLQPPARRALENSSGSFPNFAYYHARVRADKGLATLFDLYERRPDKRLPVCLAIGEVCQKEAGVFLLGKAKTEKTDGGLIMHQLAGLKHFCGSFAETDLEWFLAQPLDREEIIALSDVDFRLSHDRLMAYWKLSGARRFLAIQIIMGSPDRHFDTLRWMIDQYLNAGDIDTVRQLMLSDSMRSLKAPRVQDYRDAVLDTLSAPAPNAKASGKQALSGGP